MKAPTSATAKVMATGTGMPRMSPKYTGRYGSRSVRSIGMDPPSDLQVISARKMPMVPSAAMNGSIFPTVTIKPFSRPHSAPTSMQEPAPMKLEVAPNVGAKWFITRIMMPVTNAIMDPTDRSRQPDEMTKVAPMAMMAMKADRVTTLAMFVPVAKLEFSRMPTSTTTPRAMKGPMAAHG